MVNALKKPYDVYVPVVTENDYNEKIVTYTLKDSTPTMIYISLLNHNNLTVNNIDITNSTHIGITSDTTLLKGMMINMQYEIMYVQSLKNDVILTLKEVSDNG